jgi:hypothetical protein
MKQTRCEAESGEGFYSLKNSTLPYRVLFLVSSFPVKSIGRLMVWLSRFAMWGAVWLVVAWAGRGVDKALAVFVVLALRWWVFPMGVADG